MLLHEDMNASLEAFTSNVSRCACKPSWSIARICFAAALWIKVAASLRDVPRGISTVWFTLCSATVFQHSSSQIWLSGSVNPFMPAGYLIPELGSPMKSTSDFALARLRARWCALRSRRNDTFTRSNPSSTSFGRLLGCPTDAGARLGSIADTATVLMDAACTATSAACAVDACIIARFACCALRACVTAAAACVAALAARTASFNCACCSFTN